MTALTERLRSDARIAISVVFAAQAAFGQARETMQFFEAMTNPKIAVDVSDAVEAGYVEAEYTAMGGASGPTVLVRVSRKNVSGDPRLFFLSVPAGLRLRNSNSAEQEMVVAGVLGHPTGESAMQGGREIRND